MTALMTLRRFLRDARGGATSIAAAAVAIITVGGAAVVGDHVWLVDQRDALKTASDAAGIAATHEMKRLLDQQPSISDSALQAALGQVAQRYVELNFTYLPADRFTQAIATLVVDVNPDRALRTVDVSVEADLGGTLFAQHMPLFDGFSGPPTIRVETRVERIINPIEVVLAIDISQSMENCLEQQWGRRCSIADNMRISIVKRAASKLVDILDPIRDNQVAVGVVPWHMVVRLDDITSGEWTRNGWAEYPLSRRYGATYSCGYRGGTCPAPAEDQALPTAPPEIWQGCLDEHRLTGAGSLASLPASTKLMNLPSQEAFAQSFFPAPYGTGYDCLSTPLPTNYKMNFCYDANQFQLLQGSGSRFQSLKTPQYGCDSTHPSILPLTSDRATIDGAIDGLDAVGELTYSSLGVLWGQRLLEHGWKPVWGDPIHPVDANANEGTRKALVLLTDGVDSFCDMGTGTKTSCANSTVGVDRTDACTAAKAAGTEIFVIAAMHPDQIDDEFAGTLRDCSSESEESEGTYAFLNNSTPATLEAAFADIANQLSIVRRVY